MGFVTILILVLAALVILSILFSIFKFFIGLLPVAIIVALIIWLLAKFSGNKKDTEKTDSHNPVQPSTKEKQRDLLKNLEDKEDNKNG